MSNKLDQISGDLSKLNEVNIWVIVVGNWLTQTSHGLKQDWLEFK